MHAAVPLQHVPRRRARAGRRFFVDAGGPVEPLIEAAERARHDADARAADPPPLRPRLRARRAARALAGHRGADPPAERELVAGDDRRRSCRGETLRVGGLDGRRAAHARPHRRDALAARRRQTSSPATRCSRTRSAACARPAHTTYADLKTSIMDMLHGAAAGDRRSSPATPTRRRSARSGRTTRFVRVWRGLDPEGAEPCTALGEPATLVLLGDDYDGGHKAWVRWPDGRDDIVPGSQVAARARAARVGRALRTRRRWHATEIPTSRVRAHRDASAASPPARRSSRSARARRTSTRGDEAGAGRARAAASSRPPSRSSPRWGR